MKIPLKMKTTFLLIYLGLIWYASSIPFHSIVKNASGIICNNGKRNVGITRQEDIKNANNIKKGISYIYILSYVSIDVLCGISVHSILL
jgi:hypothetical protein